MRGAAVRHRVHGGATDGPTPLLMVHGIACSGAAFGPLLAHFAASGERRPAYAPDMPGYGETPGPRRALDIAELAAWQEDYLEVVGVPRAHVLAHSMGCQVALALARQAPRRVASLILVGPTTGDQHQSLLRYGLGLAADSLVESPGWNLTLLRMALQMGPLRYIRTMPHLLRDHPIARAGQVGCPVLALRGKRDLIIPESAALRLAAALPRGEYVQLPRGAHAVQFTWPAETWTVASRFAARSDRG